MLLCQCTSTATVPAVQYGQGDAGSSAALAWLGSGSTDEAPSTAKNAAQAGRARNQVRGARKARRQSLARAWHYLRVAMDSGSTGARLQVAGSSLAR
jgi:hypothetical protein